MHPPPASPGRAYRVSLEQTLWAGFVLALILALIATTSLRR
jgi:hypothetical protein